MPRKILILTLLILVAALFTACRPGGAPAISLETTRLELGDVPNGEIVTRDVLVRNDGDAVLQIQDLSTSCGCTTARLEPMHIEPGADASLRIAFDSGAHGPNLTGPMVRQVYITSNDPARPELTVDLAVNVTPRQVSQGN